MHKLTWISPAGQAHTWGLPEGVFALPPEAARHLGAQAVVTSGGEALLLGPHGLIEIKAGGAARPGDAGGHLVFEPAAPRPPMSLGDDPTRAEHRRDREPPLGLRWRLGDVALAERPLIIGRHPACDLRVTDGRASAVHCLVQRTALGARILDLGSTNGTFVDGARVRDLVVSRRAVLHVGGCRMEILAAAEPLEHVPLTSEPMRALDELVTRVAASQAPVVVHGESGVGKDALAQKIHALSGRHGRFVVLNAAAISPTLAASELFGHLRGAFTGAETDHDGAFVAAHGGTLFLDEVAELPLATQAELLRAVEHGRVRRLGDYREIPVDVRLVTATHQNLAARVTSGAFRADLYHRLCVIPLTVPPLRERRDDIATLAAHVLVQQSPPRGLSAAALAKLKAHDWPGNVRELINTLRRASVLADDEVIEPRHLLFGPSLKRAARIDDLIHDTVLETFAQSGRSVSRTAKELGVRRATVHHHLRAARRQFG